MTEGDTLFAAAEKEVEGKPHGFIQWKGTNVCMDVYCECGCHSHIDAEFAYYVRCPKCKKIYMCNPFVRLIPVTVEQLPVGMHPSCIAEEDPEPE